MKNQKEGVEACITYEDEDEMYQERINADHAVIRVQTYPLFNDN